MPLDADIFPTVRQQIMDAIFERLGPGGLVPGVIAIVGSGDNDDDGRLSKLGDGAGKGVVMVVLDSDDEMTERTNRTNIFDEFEFDVLVTQMLDAELAASVDLTLRELAQYRHSLVVAAATAIVTDGNGSITEYRSHWNGLAQDTMILGGGQLTEQPIANGAFVLAVNTGLRIRYRHMIGKPGRVV
jgi:hypothetical protein